MIVWFTKGMLCVFCRQHMTQLARVYEEIQQRNGEVLEIAPSSPEKGRLYAAKYRLPFPYLCDPADEVRKRWRLGSRLRSPGWYLNAIATVRATKVTDDAFGKEPPRPTDIPKLLRDDDTGFFIVDRGGIIRYASTGAYVDDRISPRPIPSNNEILQALERCA